MARFCSDAHSRLVVFKSGLGLESGLKSIFAGLGLGLETAGLGLGLEKICNQVHFQFSLCTYTLVFLKCDII